MTTTATDPTLDRTSRLLERAPPRQLDHAHDRWVRGVRGLDAAALARPCGEDGFEQDPMAALVLHIHREVLHHGAEVCLLRDLYRAQRLL